MGLCTDYCFSDEEVPKDLSDDVGVIWIFFVEESHSDPDMAYKPEICIMIRHVRHCLEISTNERKRMKKNDTSGVILGHIVMSRHLNRLPHILICWIERSVSFSTPFARRNFKSLQWATMHVSPG